MKKRLPLAILVMAVLISLDQFVKYLIDSSFSVGESQPLIDNVFQLTYVQNRGAAWEPGDHRAAGIVENWGVLCAGGDSGVGRKTQESRELRKM